MGDKRNNIEVALRYIAKEVGEVRCCSSMIETEPWGFESKNTFLNAVCLVETTLSPEQCLQKTQEIERRLGRTSKSCNGTYHDRPIDIDLLCYDDVHMETPTLTLPHPHMNERDFVTIPLNEIKNKTCGQI